MQPRIIAVSDNVDVFEDVKAAERYLEPPDVRYYTGEVRRRWSVGRASRREVLVEQASEVSHKPAQKQNWH
jgi:hypothetical protein